VENVNKISDFAREYNISQLQSWCLNFYFTKIDINNVSVLMNYLDKKSKPEFADENIQLRNRALDLLFSSRLIKICENMKFYEDFILRNIDFNSIGRIAKFICRDQPSQGFMFNPNSSQTQGEKFGTLFEQDIGNLKDIVFRFVQENYEEIKDKGIMKNFPIDFFISYGQYVTCKLNKFENKTDGKG